MRKQDIERIKKVFEVDADSMAIIRQLLNRKLDPIAYEESFYSGEYGKYDPNRSCNPCCEEEMAEGDYPSDCCIYASMLPFDKCWAEQVMFHLSHLVDEVTSVMETNNGLEVTYIDRDSYNLPTLAVIAGEVRWVDNLFEVECL